MRRSLSARAVLCFGIALAVCGAAAASDWPRFRGPNGTGISTDKDVPLTWTDKENVLWKMPLPGTSRFSQSKRPPVTRVIRPKGARSEIEGFIVKVQSRQSTTRAIAS